MKQRIYAASLAAYNNGRLHGIWIDLAGKDEAEVQEEIDAMLASSPVPGEEWAIHDHEGFASYRVDQNDSLEDLVAFTKCYEDHGAVAIAASELHCHVEYIVKACEEQFQGTYNSLEDWAADTIDNCCDTKAMGRLADYIDYEAYARDCELNGDIMSVELNGQVYVFIAH